MGHRVEYSYKQKGTVKVKFWIEQTSSKCPCLTAWVYRLRENSSYREES